MRNPRILPHIEALPTTIPFVGPETLMRQRGKPFRARIGANESGFGPSPKVLQAMSAAGADIWKYADPECYDLRHAIATLNGVGPENVVVGNGIDELLGITVRLVVEPGTPVVTSLGAYPTFNFHVDAAGGRLIRVPYVDDREDPESLIKATEEHRPAILYVSNPDNPMGTWWDAATIRGLMERVPDGTMLVLDEAYSECAPEGSVPAIDLSLGHVLRFRTLSKAYGMAGARIGYAIGPAALINQFEKLRNHFGLNITAYAGAIAALEDQAYLKEAVAKIARARDRITQIALGCGQKPITSATNFVAVDMGGDGTHARAVLNRLLDNDIFVRIPGVAPLNRCVRISCGTDADMDVLAEVLPKVV